MLGRLSHPNLVKLLGYCQENKQLLGYCRESKQLLLVYEFMQKSSLDKHVFRVGSSVEPLPWDIRLKILIGAARGLAFLHGSQVIYRDFKASNILLDGSYHAKLTDFGLARFVPADDDDTHISTQVMGTHGYAAAPEYVTTGHLYVKSDVYGFGVVLVEMLTGLRALDSKRPRGQQNLVDWMKPQLFRMRSLKKVMDSSLRDIISSQICTKSSSHCFKLSSKRTKK